MTRRFARISAPTRKRSHLIGATLGDVTLIDATLIDATLIDATLIDVTVIDVTVSANTARIALG